MTVSEIVTEIEMVTEIEIEMMKKMAANTKKLD